MKINLSYCFIVPLLMTQLAFSPGVCGTCESQQRTAENTPEPTTDWAFPDATPEWMMDMDDQERHDFITRWLELSITRGGELFDEEFEGYEWVAKDIAYYLCDKGAQPYADLIFEFLFEVPRNQEDRTYLWKYATSNAAQLAVAFAYTTENGFERIEEQILAEEDLEVRGDIIQHFCYGLKVEDYERDLNPVFADRTFEEREYSLYIHRYLFEMIGGKRSIALYERGGQSITDDPFDLQITRNISNTLSFGGLFKAPKIESYFSKRVMYNRYALYQLYRNDPGHIRTVINDVTLPVYIGRDDDIQEDGTNPRLEAKLIYLNRLLDSFDEKISEEANE